MHFDPTTVSAIGGAIMGLASLVLHFTPSFTIAGRIATWLEENGQTILDAASALASQPPAKK